MNTTWNSATVFQWDSYLALWDGLSFALDIHGQSRVKSGLATLRSEGGYAIFANPEGLATFNANILGR